MRTHGRLERENGYPLATARRARSPLFIMGARSDQRKRATIILPMFFLIYFFYGRLILRPWLTEVHENFTVVDLECH